MLRSILLYVEKGLDSVKFFIKKKLNLFDPIFIYPYRSYGYKGKMIIRGRVLEYERVLHDEDTENGWHNNLFRFFKRYESDEIPDVGLKVTYRGQEYHTQTDDEGFYSLEFDYQPTKEHPFWDKVELKITETPVALKGEFQASGEVMIPDKDSAFGIISDVDDTIIKSNATNILLKLKTLALNQAKTRIAFPGVAALYRALVTEKEDRYKNPLWFISGSSWNLYDLLDRFCKEKQIPKAPFLLKELSLSADKFIKQGTIAYKMEQIRSIMKLTDPLPFILIGDSGQKDPEIYSMIVDEFPDRVKAIYIRDVTTDERDQEVKAIAKKLAEKGVDMILAEDTSEAARHAYEKDWISKEALQEVKNEIKQPGK